MSKGGRDIVQSAREKAKTILREHHPKELPVSTKKELASIIKDFEARS
jgi:trimethylamine:corrinoid methyltransferase-like protein